MTGWRAIGQKWRALVLGLAGTCCLAVAMLTTDPEPELRCSQLNVGRQVPGGLVTPAYRVTDTAPDHVVVFYPELGYFDKIPCVW